MARLMMLCWSSGQADDAVVVYCWEDKTSLPHTQMLIDVRYKTTFYSISSVMLVPVNVSHSHVHMKACLVYPSAK